MHDVKHNINSNDQLMCNNHSYFSKQRGKHKKLAIIPDQRCTESHTNKHIVCIAGYKQKHDK